MRPPAARRTNRGFDVKPYRKVAQRVMSIWYGSQCKNAGVCTATLEGAPHAWGGIEKL
jgi:hypothetical protein